MNNIWSLVPGATEILYALGLGDRITAVSHECDFPPGARRKPRAIRCRIPADASSRHIDRLVREAMHQRRPLYELDHRLLATSRPDLIVVQDTCHVCAVDSSLAAEAIRAVRPPPRLIGLHPHTLADMLDDIRRLGSAVGCERRAAELADSLTGRFAALQQRAAQWATRPTVFCLEWLEPLMATGHWVPEMVERAGGRELLGRAGASSRYVTRQQILKADPDILVVMPCGFTTGRTMRELRPVSRQPWWSRLRAVRTGRVFVVNGSALFNRAGPRLVEGTELLVRLFHDPGRLRGAGRRGRIREVNGGAHVLGSSGRRRSIRADTNAPTEHHQAARSANAARGLP